MYRVRTFFILAALLVLNLSVSAQNLDAQENYYKKHIEFLASDSLLGRSAGSAGEKKAAEYIYNSLKASGVQMLTPSTGDSFSYSLPGRDTTVSLNVYGVVPGYDPKLRNEYVVIGAHLDHLGYNVLSVDGKEVTQIYRGADDNASGVAALLESAKIISRERYLFRRSVIFAAFGAEEQGMIGSLWFLNGSFKDTSNIVMMINLDMVGRSGSSNPFRLFTGVRNLTLAKIADSTSALFPGEAPAIHPVDYFPSDHMNFYHKGIPIALLTTGLHKDYHTIRDTPDRIDYARVENVANYAVALARDVANSEEAPLARIEGSSRSGAPDERYYTQSDVDKRAQFIHGDENTFLMKWVYPYIKYPEVAVARGEQGKVVAEFIVEKDGTVSNVQIVSGVSNEIDDQVLKVISASPKWKAGRLHGKPVRVKISVIVQFKLSSNSKFGIKK